MKIALLAVVLVLAAGCSGRQEPARSRLIVLRFENLTGNPALDWMGRGAARQIGARIEGAAVADSPHIAAERERAIVSGPARILYGYVSQSGGRLRLRADIEDTASRQFRQSAEAAGPVSEGLLPLADAVARQLDPTAGAGGASSETALAAYVAALDTPDAGAASESLSRSIAADPNFGAAYLALIQLSLASKDNPAAERTLALARARGSAISPLDRARLDVAAAQLSGNLDTLSQSLAALSRLTPHDAGLLRNLGDTAQAARRYPAAIGYYRKALDSQPGDPGLLNNLGYTQAYAGDLEGAAKSLGEYERARPNEANPLDSLGDVYFFRGRFSEAERFYRQAYGKDAGFQNGAALVKAATARLMTGDVTGAEAVFAEYEAGRRRAADPMIDFARAQWDYLRGKRHDAMLGMEKVAGATRVKEAVALADCAITVWLLEAGDRQSARKRTACRFLAEPDGKSFPSPMLHAYALLLAKDFQAALPLLRELDARAPPSPVASTPTLLAWALVESGHFDEAEKYLQTTPVPAAPSPDPFQSLIFPRIFYLRAKVAEKKGAKPLADQNYRLFETLAGRG